MICFAPACAPAQDAASGAQPTTTQYHWREVWAGTQANAYGWSIYTGVTVAPFGTSGVQADGWRLRLASQVNWKGDPPDILRLSGTTMANDILVGYHHAVGPVILKGFAGATVNGRRLTELYFDQPDGSLNGDMGAKLALETWTTLSAKLWLTVDGSWSSLGNAGSVSARFGYRLSPVLSSGVETAAYRSDEGRQERLGAFARYEWDSGEISLAAGVTGRQLTFSHDHKSAYGSLTWLTRF